MLPWDLLAGEIDVAFMLDTDILVRGNLDTLFKQMTHVECKGVWRGTGEFSLTEPRPAQTIKSAENNRCHGGGINGGAVLFKPSHDTFKYMSDALKRLYSPKDLCCAEQDFWSWFFGVHRGAKLGELDVSYNFQIHQLSLAVPQAHRDSRWMELVRKPEGIFIFHYSAVPKPSNLLVGNVEEESGYMDLRSCDAWVMQHEGVDVEKRAEVLATRVFESNAARRCLGWHRGKIPRLVDSILYDVAKDATVEYTTYWFNKAWPRLFLAVIDAIWTEKIQTMAHVNGVVLP